jgi:DNA processing protein
MTSDDLFATHRPTALRLNMEQRMDWLRLFRTEGIGPRTFQTLINRYGSAGAALKELPLIAQLKGQKPPKIPSLQTIEAEMNAAEKFKANFVAWGEPEYPQLLRAIDSAPPVLAVRGRVDTLCKPCVGIVGARNASAAARNFTTKLASDLTKAGYTVVSGLARGIDSSAHSATVSQGTIGVLAGGLDKPYPPENIALMEAMLENGAVVSEMPFGWEPRGRDFPRRNRIISGLSLATIVVEASERSGSLITARFAAEQGRDVLAVPGSPMDPRCEGTNRLLKEGATMVTSSRDAIEALDALRTNHRLDPEQNLQEPIYEAQQENLWDELDWMFAEGERNTAKLYKSEAIKAHSIPLENSDPIYETEQPKIQNLLNLISFNPIHLDELSRLMKTPIQEINVMIFDLECSGHIRRLPGNLVEKTEN